ncbi:hypothetical protein [Mangrovibacter phragmitis]|uniref:hypothetical protein n=1 Tax=Mangrovibacter phragmitis TaxID=1691903 RepID=UPI003517FDD4
MAKRIDLIPQQIQRTVALMNRAVSDAMITGFEPLTDSVDLPDIDDRHVVAAAVRSNAEIIVAFNIKDFPTAALDAFGIEGVSLDIENYYTIRFFLSDSTLHTHNRDISYFFPFTTSYLLKRQTISHISLVH